MHKSSLVFWGLLKRYATVISGKRRLNENFVRKNILGFIIIVIPNVCGV